VGKVWGVKKVGGRSDQRRPDVTARKGAFPEKTTSDVEPRKEKTITRGKGHRETSRGTPMRDYHRECKVKRG